MLASGQLLADRYRLTSRIAVGGMGEVWEANDSRLDRTVAVKILKAELSGDAEFLHRFRTEARTTASLNHHGIAAVHDYGETVEPGTYSPESKTEPQHIAYLVMELVEGEPLAGILGRERRISAERALDILEQAGHALQAAHERGLVHRDVKPGNILVTPSGQVKLTDFGIAKAADAAPVTRSGMVMGTAHYIAPEQALGHDAEPASDVYSLAVCGYECLMGHRPFLSENAVTVAMMHIRDIPPPLPPDVPPHARAVIEATLVKDPRRRYASGGEFANAVAAVRAGHPLPTPAGLVNAGYAGAVPGGAPPLGQPGQPGQAAHPGQAGQAPAGPGSHPSMHPVSPATGHGPHPHLASGMTPVPQRRRNYTALWVLLALIVVLLIVGLALVLPGLIRPDSDRGPGGGVEVNSSVPGEQDSTGPTRIPANLPGAVDTQDKDNRWGPGRRSPDNDGTQGMMGTLWMGQDGTDR
jgi:tRNA A-37 threonylcarbamoyl transferase component Bud32